MRNMLTKSLAIFVPFALIALPLAASASAVDVDGDSITYQGYTYGSVSVSPPGVIGETPFGAPVAYTGGAAGVAIPGSAAGQTGGQATLSSTASVFTITDGTAFAPPACAAGQNCFEGGLITLAGQSITSVTLLSSSNASFTQADVGAASGGAFLNFQGQSITPGQTFTFSVDAVPVPLPATFWFGLSSIGGLSLLGVRRRSRAAI